MKLLLLVSWTVAMAEITKDEEVLVLTEDNFQDALDANDMLLVEFYAPWCGHCKSLAPEYAAAAKILADKESPIKLAKVDATKEVQLDQMFDVKGYPTLKLFKYGKDVEYTGGRTADTIVTWLEKKTGPVAKTLTDLVTAKAFIAENSIAVIGFFKDVESDSAKAFLAAAVGLDDYPFAVISEAMVIEELKAAEVIEKFPTDGVVLFKNFDEGMNNFKGEMTKEAIHDFVISNSLPLVVFFSQDMAMKIFTGDIQLKSLLLFFVASSDKEYPDKVAIARAIAAENKGHIRVVIINPDEEDHKRIMEFFGVDEAELPSMRIIKLEKDKGIAKFRPKTTELSEANIRKFVATYVDKEIKPPPMVVEDSEVLGDWDKEDVKVLVGTVILSLLILIVFVKQSPYGQLYQVILP